MLFAGNSKHIRGVFQLLDYGANQAHIHVLTVPPSVTDPAVDGRKDNNGDEIVNLVTYACVRVGVFWTSSDQVFVLISQDLVEETPGHRRFQARGGNTSSIDSGPDSGPRR